MRDDGADILGPSPESAFHCPIQKRDVPWEDKQLLCATAAVKDGKVYLLYRAENRSRVKTSRIGLAISEDGRHFKRQAAPVLYPDEDACKAYEWTGGCVDPRVVVSEDGTYVMTYTAYDGKRPRLFVATSTDLVHWQKHRSAFARFAAGKYADLRSKSGAIICRQQGEKFVATRVNGKYWMYFGEFGATLATSDNLLDWDIVETDGGKPLIVLPKRPGFFDGIVTEPGPFAMLTARGILLIYNGGSNDRSDLGLKGNVWSVGQALFDSNDPAHVIARTDKNCFHPERPYAIWRKEGGGTQNVTFVESLIWFNNEWRFYYGCADSMVASACYRPTQSSK